ncbi:MAG: cytochrome c [Gammaproteobacteria bacterium]|jgi:mono/diheme cytochrome c family protein|nr:hypothetical protein [Gammaproteobacteria bacterium]MDP6096089.1 cytochrome c [Gammaproteobacteria bacterium]HJO12359.1 cytochrome c [Gammaproteobacteria bacterium]|tara:strand:- start:950 stop:1423 length:474 start_codon:yes stop_codon:yes gene_type:complete
MMNHQGNLLALFSVSRISFAVLAAAFTLLNIYGPSYAQPAPGLWDGLYTEEQASRGQTVYRASCTSCHSEDLRGNSNAPSLIGMSFMFLWETRPLGTLFEKIQAEMPTENPGSLSEQSYLDVLSYIMQVNSFPAGIAELVADMDKLNQVVITPKPAQ